ncbi:MAG: CDP-diacylglycerol O-phosphatidyltransferase [Opitutae bacterium]|nr:CDP-diacylglycerol O-phosphatidyltransferase [Opitutae bacterium]|tara:strand:+ start:1641 stop:2483 length:843 start_codon:yes stop_codon:yes gene_type:complete
MNSLQNDEQKTRRPHKAKQLSLPRLLPNILTTIGMCAGLTSIRFALEGDWEKAVFAILVAGAFDTVDGLSARIFGSSSRFGAELDSLADVISFGVAPAIVLYLWIREPLIKTNEEYLLEWYWIPMLAFTTCSALRLARFNVSHNEEPSKNKPDNNYLVGVPAPAGAGLASMPMGLEFILKRFDASINISEFPVWILFWIVIVSALTISQVPTFSFRNMRFRVPRHQAIIVLVLTSLSFAVLEKEPWIFLFSIGVIYMGSLPISIWAEGVDRRKVNKSKNK